MKRFLIILAALIFLPSIALAVTVGWTYNSATNNVTPYPNSNTTASTSLFSASTVWDSDLTSGNCVQAGFGGILTTTGAACGTGSSASSTLLSDNNTFSGSDIFTKALNLSATTGTTTFASGQGLTVGGSNFVVQQGSGNVGIGTTSPTTALQVKGSFQSGNLTNLVTGLQSSHNITLSAQIGYNNTGANLGLTDWRGTGNNGNSLFFVQGGGSGEGDYTAVSSSQKLGAVSFEGTDGSAFQEAARIYSGVDGTVSSGIIPGNLQFFTQNTSGTLVDRLHITSAGFVGIGSTTPGSLLSLGSIANFTAATSTFYSTGGINLTGGCFSINNVCISGGSSASSTLLSDNNTFSGTNSFSSLITGSVSGNAGTVTNGVYTTTFNSLFDPRFVTDLAATTSVNSITTLNKLSLPYSQITGAPTSMASSTILSDNNTFSGNNAFTPHANDSVLFQNNSLGVTVASTSGIFLQNTTASAAGAQQDSPALTFEGQGWNTTAVASSTAVDMTEYLLPVQGTTVPTANLIWARSIDQGNTWTTDMILTSGGTLEAVAGLGTSNTTNGDFWMPAAITATNYTLAQYYFGGVTNTAVRTAFYGSTPTTLTANSSYAAVDIGRAPITTAASGVHPFLANLAVLPIGSVTQGASTVTNTATLYLDGAATTTVTGTDWNLYASSTAPNFFGGPLTVNSGTSSATGINLTSGCFAINSTCVATGGASSTLLSDNNTFSGTNSFSKSPLAVGTNGNGWVDDTVGNTWIYASSTNQSAILGFFAGGNGATTSPTVEYETAMGYKALQSNTTGLGNTAVGNSALQNETNAGYNTAFGADALQSLTFSGSSFGTAIGYFALQADTFGQHQTGIGYDALSTSNNSRGRNTAVGYAAIGSNVAGTDNAVLGASAGDAASASFSTSTLMGFSAGFGLTSGSENTFIGAQPDAGSNAAVTTGSQNIEIGYDVAVPSATANGQMSIGNIIYGTGNTGTQSTVSAGNIGIATTTPTATLTVQLASSTLSTARAFDVWGIINAVDYLFERIDEWGHLITSGPAPTITSCGSTPSGTVSGNDRNGTITVGGTATGCVLTFAHAYATAPDCVISNQGMSVVNALTYTVSASAITISQTGLSSDLVNYICQAHQ